MTPRTIRRIFNRVREVEDFGGIDEHVDFVSPIVAILVAFAVFGIRCGNGLSLNMMRPRICGNAGKNVQMHTVKIWDFSAIQNLREIIFEDLRSSKGTIFADSESLN